MPCVIAPPRGPRGWAWRAGLSFATDHFGAIGGLDRTDRARRIHGWGVLAGDAAAWRAVEALPG